MKVEYMNRCPEIEFLCCDAIKFSEGQYDVIIDKACLDATLCGSEKQPNPNT